MLRLMEECLEVRGFIKPDLNTSHVKVNVRKD